MPRKAPRINVSDEVRMQLEHVANSRSEEARRILRARVILGCSEGAPVMELAATLGVRPNTVIACRNRFEQEGLKALDDRPRSGKPPKYGEEFGKKIIAKLEERPPAGMGCWDGGMLASALGMSRRCRVAVPQEEWNMPQKTAELVREHRPGVRGEGGGHRRALP